MLLLKRATELNDATLVAWAKAYQPRNPVTFKSLFLMPWMITEMFDKLEDDRSFMGEDFYQQAVKQMATEIRDGIKRFRAEFPTIVMYSLLHAVENVRPCDKCCGIGFLPPKDREHEHGGHCFVHDNEMFTGWRKTCPRVDVECQACLGLGSPELAALQAPEAPSQAAPTEPPAYK